MTKTKSKVSYQNEHCILLNVNVSVLSFRSTKLGRDTKLCLIRWGKRRIIRA